MTVEKDADFHPTETAQSTLPQQVNPVTIATVSYKLDQTKLLGVLKPVVASAVKASLLEHPIQAVASVDRNVLLANNETTMQLVNTKWNQWFEKKKADLQKTVKPQVSARPQPQIAFRSGDDVVYKVPEEELYGSDIPQPHSARDASSMKKSLLKRLLSRIYEDMVSCWWKVGAYVACMCSMVFNCYLGYKNYRMNNIVKEYDILKPALMHHRDFRNLMKSLDEVLNEDDIDDVLKRSEDRDKKSK